MGGGRLVFCATNKSYSAYAGIAIPLPALLTSHPNLVAVRSMAELELFFYLKQLLLTFGSHPTLPPPYPYFPRALDREAGLSRSVSGESSPVT